MAKGIAICALVVLAMAHVMLEPVRAINCFDVDMALSGCVPYLTGRAADPAAACCAGLYHIKDIATTTADRQAACNCLKAAATHLPGLKDSCVRALPGKCGAPLPYPISVSIDCSKIH